MLGQDIYEDFYGKAIDGESAKFLEKYSKELIQKTLKKDPERTEVNLSN